MKTKYAKQINKYGITTIDNRRSHDCRVIKSRRFESYLDNMKANLSRDSFIKRCEQLELAAQYVKAVIGCRAIN